ncbi:TetR/AcrR family transcriptional regulator [Actinophytocola gossypii]|uniref:TetR/AcrR family transcriptional regulator n=1 Tax=Actinophytocola gossypii TaxID=2812003 RepID=A0ABT2J9T0_9PSEU|nr:TetR/AcrR family transcriptional regulator [Actinophytocola gossypii]MCT2584200.1 TetR/AcrR family transcriptional regulator [Actinophytocola gossypii]
MDPKAPMRDRIVTAALECMRERGVGGTTTRSVARRAGVSEGSIYNHFANRSELIVEAFGLATEAIRGRARELEHLVGTGSVEENLVTLMAAVIDFFREIAPIVGSIVGDPELRSWFTEGKVPGQEGGPLTPLTGVVEVSGYLEHEHEAGRLPGRGPWVVCASMIIGACLHYVYLELLSPAGIAGLRPDDETSPLAHSRAVVRALFDAHQEPGHRRGRS